MCYNGAWNSVCDYRWGYQEAFVVCRQLGLPATGTVIYWFHTTHACNLLTDAQAVYYSNSFGYGHGIPTLNNWRCFGNETILNDCLQSTSSCFYSYSGVYRLAGVVCNGSIIPGNE